MPNLWEPEPAPVEAKPEPRQWPMLLLIVLLGLGLRMYHISSPPDDFLSWRDTQTLMVARNFFESGMNLFQPAVDWRNTLEEPNSGTVGMTELMVTPWLTAWLYHLFGIEYWVNRVVPIFFSLLGIFLFHRLAARFQGETRASVAAALLTVSPYFLYCGRCQMPEAFAFAMVFAALYWFDRWLEDRTPFAYVLAVCFTLLMLLGKPPMGVMALPMAYMALTRFGWRTVIESRLYAFALLVGVPFAAYSWWSNVHLVREAQLSFGGPSFYQFRRWLEDPEYYRSVGMAIFTQSVTPAICVLGLLGLLVPPYGRRGFFAHFWLLGAAALFFAFPGGTAFNGYYQLILEPPFALLAARILGPAFARRRARPWAGLVLAGSAAYALSVAAPMFLPLNAAERHCGEWIDANLPEDALVLTESANPACLYFSHRKGWTAWQEYHGKAATFGLELIQKVTPLGADALAVTNPYFDNAYSSAFNGIRDVLYENYRCVKGGDFTVFLLNEPPDLAVTRKVVFGKPGARKYLRGQWGPDQNAEDGTPFTTMGPALEASIQVESPGKPAAIVLGLAAAVSGQTCTARVNGEWIGTVEFPQSGQRAEMELANLPPPDAEGRYTVTLEATEQNRDGVSLILYTLAVVPRAPVV